MARKYELRRRAEQQEETRQRIIEAAVELHQTVGGAKASIKAIAELSGVERLTVYRHFPDEKSLISACTSHYYTQNPTPELEPWQAVGDPAQRLKIALAEIYAFHRRTEQMSVHAMQDVDAIPALREVLAPHFAYWERARDVLLVGWESRDEQRSKQIRAALGHAIAFNTWRSLIREQGLTDAEAVNLMLGFVRCQPD